MNYNAAIGFKEVWHSEQYETPVLGQIKANELYLFAHGTGNTRTATLTFLSEVAVLGKKSYIMINIISGQQYYRSAFHFHPIQGKDL